MPGFPVLHYLLELAQTHVHQIDDATQPSHSLLHPSPHAFSLSQHATLNTSMGFPGGSDGKEFAFSAEDPGSIPGWGRSPGREHGNPLQYSCLEYLTDGGAWWPMVHKVSKSWTLVKQLSMHIYNC